MKQLVRHDPVLVDILSCVFPDVVTGDPVVLHDLRRAFDQNSTPLSYPISFTNDETLHYSRTSRYSFYPRTPTD